MAWLCFVSDGGDDLDWLMAWNRAKALGLGEGLGLNFGIGHSCL